MRITAITVFAFMLACGASVHGQVVDHCTELLRQSRMTSRTVMGRDRFTRTVRNLCDEARSAASVSGSLNVDLRMLGLGEGGSSNTSTNSTLIKYCSEVTDERRDDFNYQQYLEGLAPGAYAAYDACTRAATNGVRFELLPPTRDELQLLVSFPTDDPNGVALMSWRALGPVTCQWESFDGGGTVEASRQLELGADQRTRLACERDSFNSEPINEPNYVNVIRDGGSATINVPWHKYGPAGHPVPTLEEIRRKLESETARLRDDLRMAEESAVATTVKLDSLLGRTWHDVTERRNAGRCYLNDTGLPVELAVTTRRLGTNGCNLVVYVGQQTILRQSNAHPDRAKRCAATVTVPSGSCYGIRDQPGRRSRSWLELRREDMNEGELDACECGAQR